MLRPIPASGLRRRCQNRPGELFAQPSCRAKSRTLLPQRLRKGAGFDGRDLFSALFEDLAIGGGFPLGSLDPRMRHDAQPRSSRDRYPLSGGDADAFRLDLQNLDDDTRPRPTLSKCARSSQARAQPGLDLRHDGCIGNQRRAADYREAFKGTSGMKGPVSAAEKHHARKGSQREPHDGSRALGTL